jgi:hypothetical protein
MPSFAQEDQDNSGPSSESASPAQEPVKEESPSTQIEDKQQSDEEPKKIEKKKKKKKTRFRIFHKSKKN